MHVMESLRALATLDAGTLLLLIALAIYSILTGGGPSYRTKSDEWWPSDSSNL